MSILIKGMDMPNKCTRCIAFRLAEKPIPWDGDVIYEPSVYPYCVLLEREVTCDSKETDCPLIEIEDEEMNGLINLYKICKGTSEVKSIQLKDIKPIVF